MLCLICKTILVAFLVEIIQIGSKHFQKVFDLGQDTQRHGELFVSGETMDEMFQYLRINRIQSDVDFLILPGEEVA